MIAAILAGETQVYHELIRPYERSVYMMALSYMKNEADADDVAQEAFVGAFRHLASFRAEAKFSTWLISITLNEARSPLRRQFLGHTVREYRQPPGCRGWLALSADRAQQLHR
jgi:RNA polymerase sigma-70 factor (ECF subfamily)